ncbi:hypothetical protein MARI151_60542 [Maribacter litoralis]|uniref:Uncharacterized protein n=1 Tax=Maribacter litoralis TaxID=2059726 RepID=A0A653XDX9_9FLAO|nr:hypothetical protein MARI151_60542 [Maribacter litoralis]
MQFGFIKQLTLAADILHNGKLWYILMNHEIYENHLFENFCTIVQNIQFIREALFYIVSL